MDKIKLTPKQERFCQVYIETGNASEAYRQAYNAAKMKPETVNRTAKQLLDNRKIAARLDELREEHAKRHEITVDDLVAELEEARKLAFETDKAAAAVSATMGKAKLLGLVVEKQETNIVQPPKISVAAQTCPQPPKPPPHLMEKPLPTAGHYSET